MSCNQTPPQVLISNVVDFVSVDVRNKLIICIMNKYITYLKEEHIHGMLARYVSPVADRICGKAYQRQS
jgi:hypothetical protein